MIANKEEENMAYRETNYYSVTNSAGTPVPVTIHRISTNRADHIVDFKYTRNAVRSFEECIENPTNRPGYEVVAAINGGGFVEDSLSVISSLQIRNSNGAMVEYGSDYAYPEGTYGIGIFNDQLKNTYIYGKGNCSVTEAEPDMLRGAFKFSMLRTSSGNMTVQYTLANNVVRQDAIDLYNERAQRVGIAFTSNNAYFLFVETAVTGDELKQALEQAGYSYYVNMDGGRSSYMYADGEILKSPLFPREIMECIYLMKYVGNNNIAITGYGLHVHKLGLNVRAEPSASSTLLTTAQVGQELKIRYFLPGFQSDGYQWAAVWFNGYSGYSQIDTLGYYSVVRSDTSVIVPDSGISKVPDTLYLMTSSSGAYMRTAVVTGTRTFIPANTKIKVIELLPGFQSDGYQWVKVEYNGSTGYVQADVKNWHYFITD